jgi:hypothetical protein
MPASLVKKLGTKGAAAFTLTVPAGGVPIGDVVFVAVNAAVTGASGITDTRGNAYVQDISHSVNNPVQLWRAPVTVALLAADVITVAGVVAPAIIAGAQFTGLLASPLDKTAGNNGTAAGWTSGTTAATTQADELAIVVFGQNSAFTATITAPYTKLDELQDNTASNDFLWGYNILAAAGTQSASGNAGGATAWDTVIATYKATASVAPPFIPRRMPIGV